MPCCASFGHVSLAAQAMQHMHSMQHDLLPAQAELRSCICAAEGSDWPHLTEHPQAWDGPLQEPLLRTSTFAVTDCQS